MNVWASIACTKKGVIGSAIGSMVSVQDRFGSPPNQILLKGKTVTDIVESFGSSFLVGSSDGSIVCVDAGGALTSTAIGKFGCSSRFACSTVDSLFAVSEGSLRKLSVVDLASGGLVASFPTGGVGPVAFSSEPNLLYHGGRDCVDQLDMRESGAVSTKLKPHAAGITFASYSNNLHYSLVACSAEGQVAAFSRSEKCLQIFDLRSTRSPVWEWSLECAGFGQMSFSSDSRILQIFQPTTLHAFVVRIDSSTASPVSQIPTAPSWESQVERSNEQRHRAALVRHENRKDFRRGAKLISARLKTAVEFSVGTCFSTQSGDLLSLTSTGLIYQYKLVVGNAPIPHPRKRPLTLFPPPRDDPRSPAAFDDVPQPLSQPRTQLSRLQKFFIRSLVYLGPLRCRRHCQPAVPGSFVWNLCASKCLQSVGQKKAPPATVARVTTLARLQYAIAQQYGDYVPDEVLRAFAFQELTAVKGVSLERNELGGISLVFRPKEREFETTTQESPMNAVTSLTAPTQELQAVTSFTAPTSLVVSSLTNGLTEESKLVHCLMVEELKKSWPSVEVVVKTEDPKFAEQVVAFATESSPPRKVRKAGF